MRSDDPKLSTMQSQIKAMRAAAEELMDSASGFPAMACNTRRILASIAMLELNVEDVEDQAD